MREGELHEGCEGELYLLSASLGTEKSGFFCCASRSFSTNFAPLPLCSRLSSSSSAKAPTCRASSSSSTWLLSSNSMEVHGTPSASYSACCCLNTSELNCCCSTSLASAARADHAWCKPCVRGADHACAAACVAACG